MSQIALRTTPGQSGQAVVAVFWRRWVGANALAETVGLGSSLLLTAAFIFGNESLLGVWLSASVVVFGSALLEGTAVGLAQWAVLRQRLSALPWRHWWLATALGALVAWAAGMIPSTVMSLQSAETVTPAPEIPDSLVYTLAALMGLGLGVILALPQWWVLRRYVARAGWWLPANMAAWALGMPLIFIGVGLASGGGAVTLGAVLILLTSLAAAGAVVGAVHGAVLVRLLGGRINDNLHTTN